MLESEDDPYLRDQIMQLYNPFYKGMQDPEQYFQNTDDIINEEDLEESVDESRRQSPDLKRTTSKKDPSQKVQPMKENSVTEDKKQEPIAPKQLEQKQTNL